MRLHNETWEGWLCRTLLIAGIGLMAGCAGSDRDILVDRAMDRAAEGLAVQVCESLSGNARTGVMKFSGKGPAGMANKVLSHLTRCGMTTDLLPDSEEMVRAQKLIWTMLGQADYYKEGELPEFEFEGPGRVFVGRFLWFRSRSTLALVGIEGHVVDVRKQGMRVLWSGEAHGAYVEHSTLMLRLALFALIFAVVWYVRRQMWESAMRAGGILWALAILMWAVAFWWLLQDYVFYLWKVA